MYKNLRHFISLLVGLGLCFPGIFAQSNSPSVQEEIQSMIAALDNGSRGGTLQDPEFVVALFQQIVGQDPTSEELLVCTSLLRGKECTAHQGCHTTRIARSQLLALLLARKEQASSLSMEQLEKTLPVLRSLNLETVPFWKPTVAEETTVTLPENRPIPRAHREAYKLYYGYLHSHTSYSDGDGVPEEAYAMARDTAKLDFFAVTDHSELISLWPWDREWEKLKKAAASFHQENVFVALHGFEWSSPLLGHINVINSEEMTCCIRTMTVKGICQWIAERPAAISRFNHPGYLNEWGVEFDHFQVYPFVVQQMVGIEMYNGGSGVKKYFYAKGYFGQFNHQDEANQKGWMVGTVGGQDNHGKDWGMKNPFVVGVWATSLTKEGILEAYRERRTFATEDRNLRLSFQMDGAEMGSRMSPGQHKLTISVSDGDQEKFTRLAVYRKGTLLRTFEMNMSNPQVNWTIDTQAGEYYYVVVTQADGDEALSSPIWIVSTR